MNITVSMTTPEYGDTLYQSYTLNLEVTASEDMPMEIFVFQAAVAPALTNGEDPYDEFVNIASPVDLEEIPVDPPVAVTDNPYYRGTKLTLKFRSLVELNTTWNYIKSDIQGLIDALKMDLTRGDDNEFQFS
jgi:hypothetical protein